MWQSALGRLRWLDQCFVPAPKSHPRFAGWLCQFLQMCCLPTTWRGQLLRIAGECVKQAALRGFGCGQVFELFWRSDWPPTRPLLLHLGQGVSGLGGCVKLVGRSSKALNNFAPDSVLRFCDSTSARYASRLVGMVGPVRQNQWTARRWLACWPVAAARCWSKSFGKNWVLLASLSNPPARSIRFSRAAIEARPTRRTLRLRFCPWRSGWRRWR